jgi:hypothetical protein
LRRAQQRDQKKKAETRVDEQSGPPVSGLQQPDFTVLDNKVPQTLLTFQAVRGREAPIEVVLVLDDVNTGFANVAYERSEIDKFLRTDGGQLAHPMALAFLTDDGIKVQDEFSSDGNELSAGLDKSSLGLQAGKSDQSYYANAHPYVDLPMAQLVERIPELKTLQPAPDEQELPVILQKLGRSVDDFVREIGDLIAREAVTQEKLNAKGKIKAKERVQDNYLILHHGYAWGASAEYRMDDKGNRLGAIGLEKGYLVTSGYALSCISFSTVAQSQSRFRYLGRGKDRLTRDVCLGICPAIWRSDFPGHDEGNRRERCGYADARNLVAGQV